MRQSYLDDLKSAITAQDLLTGLIDVAGAMGLPLGSLLYRQGPLNLQGGGIKSVGNVPEAWLENSKRLDLAVADPVFMRLNSSREPFFYDADFYGAAGAGPLHEECRRYGYAYGVSASLHLPGNRLVAVGFDSPDVIARDASVLTKYLSMTQLVAVFAASAAERIFEPAMEVLNSSQKAVLVHARNGRSSWHISQLMGISENTVNYHVKSAKAVLGVRTRIQAIDKALQLGLIS